MDCVNDNGICRMVYHNICYCFCTILGYYIFYSYYVAVQFYDIYHIYTNGIGSICTNNKLKFRRLNYEN